jgi:carbon monoxide dehydrogenase subunit G
VKLENSFTIDAPVEKAWQALNTPQKVAPCFPGATLTSYEGDSFSGTVKVKLGPIAMTYKGKGTYVSRDEAAHEVVIDATGRDSRGNGTASAKVTAALAADGPDKTAVTMVTDMTITGKPAQFGRGVISDLADKIIGQFSACVAQKLGAEEAAVPAAPSSTAGSEAISDAPTAPARPAPTPPVPAAGSEAISDSVPERAATSATNGAAPTEAPTTTAVGAPAPTDMTAPEPATATPVTPATTAVRTPAAAPTGPVRSEVDAIDLLDSAGGPVVKRLLPVAGGVALLVLVVLIVRRLLAGR